MELLGRNILITGGAVRIGQAIARKLAASGANIALHYGRSTEAAEETARELAAAGVKVVLVQGDLSDPDAPQRVVLESVAGLGVLHGLINSAAVFLDGGLMETTPEMWEIQTAINLRSPFFLSQAFVAQLPEGESGAIVNLVDARNRQSGTDHCAYRLSKIGLETLTRNLALELAPRIRVNAVALGAILPPPGFPQSYLDEVAKERVPLQRAGSAEIVAENVLHLLQQDFLTGVVLPIDGGEFL